MVAYFGINQRRCYQRSFPQIPCTKCTTKVQEVMCMKKTQCDVCDDLLFHIICDVLCCFSRQKQPEMCKYWIRPTTVLHTI